MTDRDKKIIADCEAQGIPMFVLTAKDELSTSIIDLYAQDAEDAGCTPEFVKGVTERVTEFEEWQAANPTMVKLPD